MEPPCEARGAQITFRCRGLVRSHAATRDGLQLERDKTEDMVVVDVEVGRDREAAAHRAARALVRPTAERQTPALDPRVDGAVRIEPRRVDAKEARIPVRRGYVDDHMRAVVAAAVAPL